MEMNIESETTNIQDPNQLEVSSGVNAADKDEEGNI